MSPPFFTIKDLELENKTVLMRVDINSPINPETGEILSTKRIEETVWSIRKLPACKLVLLAHQSRPGKKDYTDMSQHAKALSKYLDRDVKYMDSLFSKRAIDAVESMKVGEIMLLENTRFYAEEEVLADQPLDVQANSHLVKKLSKVSNVFVNDAFSAIHRGQPSLVGFCKVLPSCAGPLMEKELKALSRVTENPERPCIAILGGLKVDDSIKVAEHLLKNKIIDKLLCTGVVGSMFQWADGFDLGTPNVNFIRSELKECDKLLEKCKQMLKDNPGKVLYPTDMALNVNGERQRITIKELPANAPIYDIGIETIARFSNMIREARTIIANGPAGVFELEAFKEGTVEIFKAINESKGYSVMGGGETTQVIADEKLQNIDHVSTGGGALISYLTGKEMPIITALKKSKERFQGAAGNNSGTKG